MRRLPPCAIPNGQWRHDSIGAFHRTSVWRLYVDGGLVSTLQRVGGYWTGYAFESYDGIGGVDEPSLRRAKAAVERLWRNRYTALLSHADDLGVHYHDEGHRRYVAALRNPHPEATITLTPSPLAVVDMLPRAAGIEVREIGS